MLPIRSFEACTTDHHIDAMLMHISRDAVPQQFDCAFGSIGGKNAGAAKLEEALARMSLQQVGYFEFTGAIETGMSFRDFLPKKAIRSHDRRFARDCLCQRTVNNYQVVA